MGKPQAVANDETSNLTSATFALPLPHSCSCHFGRFQFHSDAPGIYYYIYIHIHVYTYTRAKWKITGTLPVAFAARQTFIVVRKEVIFIHISRYTFCTRSCIFMARQPGERTRARRARARTCSTLAIKGSERTLFKPDTSNHRARWKSAPVCRREGNNRSPR